MNSEKLRELILDFLAENDALTKGMNLDAYSVTLQENDDVAVAVTVESDAGFVTLGSSDSRLQVATIEILSRHDVLLDTMSEYIEQLNGWSKDTDEVKVRGSFLVSVNTVVDDNGAISKTYTFQMTLA